MQRDERQRRYNENLERFEETRDNENLGRVVVTRVRNTEDITNERTHSRYGREYRRPARYPEREINNAYKEITSKIGEEVEPEDIKDALKNPKWIESMKKELQSMRNHRVWSLVPRPKDRKTIRNRWVYKIKTNEKGNIEEYKSRLVACGYSQISGLDYKETYSPVVNFDTLRILFEYAAKNDSKIHHVDVSNAFLNGNLEEELYMEQPEGFQDKEKPQYVCKLHKSIYGLKQSSRCWNNKFKTTLQKYDFIQNIGDSCLYTKNTDKGKIFVIVYVDDIIICANNDIHLNYVKNILSNNFKIKDLGPVKYFLGINVENNDKQIKLHQETYIKSVINKFNLSECKVVSTPLNESLLNSKDENRNFENIKIYQSAIGSLNYLACKTRPDIAFAVNFMARKNCNPTVHDYTNVKNIIKYLKATSNYGINF